MVKKCLIAIAVVALLATTVQAIDNPLKKEGGWPFHWTVTYDEIDVCTFPVKLEVGYYVQIKDCGDMLLKLTQVDCATIEADEGDHADDFPCYRGCVKTLADPVVLGFEARANFPAVFGARFDAGNRDITDDIIGENWDLNWGPGDDNQIVGDGSYELLKLCMEAWNVELWNSGSGNTSGVVQVGEITISVKPPLADDSGDESTWPPSP